MKKIVLTGILLGAAAFSCQLNAQVKKAIAKPKAAVAAIKGPVLNKIDFFDLAPDDAVQILNDELKKVKILLTDITEEPSYFYDNAGKKTTLRSTFRRLDFEKDFSARIISDDEEQITNVAFSLNNSTLKHFKNVKKMLGYSIWPTISVTDTDTIYRSGNMIASSSGFISHDDAGKITSQSIEVSVRKINPYTFVPKNPKQFDSQNLSVHDDAGDLGYAMVDLMKRLGVNLLYKEDDIAKVDEDDGLEGYICSYNFDKSVWVSINTTNTRRPERIYIQCQDPITFSRVKKSLGFLQWPEAKGSAYDDPDADYYSHKNVVITVQPASKGISIAISPLLEDVATRLEYTFTPTFDELVKLYRSGTPEQVAQSIAASYVTMVEYDNTNKLVPNSSADKLTFFYKTPNNKTARCTFMYNDPKFQKGTEIYVGSSDRIYMKELMSQYIKANSNQNHQINLNGTRVKYPSDFDQIWLLNKTTYDQEVARSLAEKQQQEAELARIKERERLEAIEKEKERAARSAETLNKLADFLKNSGKKQ